MYLCRIIETARVEAGEHSHLLKTIGERIPMNDQSSRSFGRAAILRKEHLERVQQFGLVVERAQEMRSKLLLGLLVEDAHKRRCAQAIEAMHTICAIVAPADCERRTRIMV